MILNGRFTMYSSDQYQESNAIFDCIYAYLYDNAKSIGEPNTHNYQLIPYCRRPDMSEKQTDIDNFSTNHGQMISFVLLKKQGITSEQLLTWMAPIDVAERYEKYNGNTQDIFYNCSSPWFGSLCQYKFDYDTLVSFADIVNLTFTSHLKLCHSMENSTCYPFLSDCYRGPSPICLDWREICDGKYDCMNGEDEQQCEQLEVNECSEGEYRCHYGGQCIPSTLVEDGRTNVDCLDASDEIDAGILYNTIMMVSQCRTSPTFLCEECSSRYPHSFSCSDGQFVPSSLIGSLIRSCFNGRDFEINRILITSNTHVSNIDCQQTLRCLIRISNNVYTSCSLSISNDFNISHCKSLSEHCFSEWVSIPQQPILFGFFQFLYATNRSISEFETNVLPDLVCFNPQRCLGLLHMNMSIERINDLTCLHTDQLITQRNVLNYNKMEYYFKDVIRRCLTLGTELSCSSSSLFHCPKSLKCISYHRVVDSFPDCYYGEDEMYPACQLNHSSRFTCLSNSSICLSKVAVGNLIPDCPTEEDEMSFIDRFRSYQPPFSYLCNYRNEMKTLFSGEIDETYCEQWPCHNPHSQCDGLWHCLNGIDELNCPNSKCLPHEHPCKFDDESNTTCLSIEYLFDMHRDECPLNETPLVRYIYFDNSTNIHMNEYISWNKTKCITKNKICRWHLVKSDLDNDTCLFQNRSYRNVYINSPSINRTGSCDDLLSLRKRADRFSSTSHLGFFPPAIVPASRRNIQTSTTTMPTLTIAPTWHCNRGVLIQVRSNKNSLISNTIDKCLCPPSYFGDRCQWQNQRVSLTLKLAYRTSTLANVVFQLIIMLIDEDGHILSDHEQITFIPSRHCNTKFNSYLLYPHRPKRLSTNYSIRIDIFRRTTLDYHTSWYLSIPFQFLPVNRLAAHLLIPESTETGTETCPLLCGNHGQCRQYANKKDLFFCHCDQEYSGPFCNSTHTCPCSNDSICLSSSICVCPLHKFGPQCYLKQSTCQSSNNSCKNNGVCIPNDNRINGYTISCLCPEDYSGETCEIHNNRIDIEFNETLLNNLSSVLFHFITIFIDKDHEQTTTFKKIPYNNHTITIYAQHPYNILFSELNNHTYYLTVVRETFINSEHIHAKVQSNQRCSSINELMNDTFLNYELVRRIKYYPMLCRQYKQVMCLYDDKYMCVCDLDRFSNCFYFNQSSEYNCQGQNICKNNGRCFENNATCPTKTMCVCDECYYGSRCEYSSKGFILSLDPIIGYHIKPDVSINQQPLIIKISIGIITCIFIFGLITGSLSIMTFRMKDTREVGCGFYLLASASISLCMLTMLKVKFWILVLSQKSMLTNRSFLTFSCIVTDGSLKSLLVTNEWLNACVAMERMLTVLQGAQFNKSKSKRIVKWAILIILLLAISTNVHDPIKRELIDDFDMDDKRTWCFVRYSSFLEKYNFAMNLFHFVVPMLINFISAVTIIISTARSRTAAQSKLTFMQHLQLQLKEHKHLLLTPCLLILLGSPRLIIPLYSGCMKSPRNPYLFVIGYFISFVPMTLHFFIFVLPSKKYMGEFKKTIRQIQRRFTMRFMSSH